MNKIALFLLLTVSLGGCATKKTGAHHEEAATAPQSDAGVLETADLQLEQRKLRLR